MKKCLIAMTLLALVVVLAVGCAGAPTPAPTPTPTVTPTPPVGLFLEVTEPLDESVVTTSPVRVSGTTIPDVVLSVNGEIVEVDEQGNFTIMVALEEGPNIIEVIASDLEGNEVSKILVIFYIP